MCKQRLHVKKKIKKVFKYNQIIFIIQYRNFQYRVPRCPVPSTEMSHMFSTEMSRSRDVLIPYMYILLVIQKLWSLSMFQTIFLPHQHGRSALDTSRTLFLLASTQGVSCRLVMNHLIYMYMFTLTPLIYMWVSVCTFMCIYLFSCPSVPAPQLLIFHREYLGWYIGVVYQS
jgi:hypothetical protein